MVREIVFEIRVEEITEKESRRLVQELVERDIISGEKNDRVEAFEYIAYYEGREYILTHSTEEECLTTTKQFWENGQRLRDRWMGGGDTGVIMDVLQRLCDLRDEIKNVTDKDVVDGPRQLH